MLHKVQKLLVDIRIACGEIENFISGKSLSDYIANRLLQLALEREFEIIGEALNRLERLDPERLLLYVPECRKIIGFRNIIAHGYDIVDDETIWDLALNRSPELLSQVERYLAAIGA